MKTKEYCIRVTDFEGEGKSWREGRRRRSKRIGGGRKKREEEQKSD